MLFDPERLGEEEEDSVEFQTTGEHDETENPFCSIGNKGEAASSSHYINTYATIGDRAKGIEETVGKWNSKDGEDSATHEHHHKIDGDESEHLHGAFEADTLTIELYSLHCGRIHGDIHFIFQKPPEDDKAVEFCAAGGASGATTHSHKHDEYETREWSPLDEVRHHDTGRRDHCHTLKEGGDCGILPIGDKIIGEHRDKEDNIAHQNEDAKPLEGIIAEKFTRIAGKSSINKVEVDATDKHEYCQYDNNVGAIPFVDVHVVGGETSGGEGGKTMAHGLKKVHLCEPKRENTHQSERNIDEPQRFGSVADTRADLVVGDTGHLLIKHQHSTFIIKHGDNCQCEEDYTEATNPLHQASPEQQRMWKTRHTAQYGGAGGGEAAHSLKERIGNGGVGAGEQEGEHSEKGEYDPNEGCEQDSLSLAHVVAAGTQAHHDESGSKSDTDRKEHWRSVSLLIYKGNRHGDGHEKGEHHKQPAYDAQKHTDIDVCTSLTCQLNHFSTFEIVPERQNTTTWSPSSI